MTFDDGSSFDIFPGEILEGRDFPGVFKRLEGTGKIHEMSFGIMTRKPVVPRTHPLLSPTAAGPLFWRLSRNVEDAAQHKSLSTAGESLV